MGGIGFEVCDDESNEFVPSPRSKKAPWAASRHRPCIGAGVRGIPSTVSSFKVLPDAVNKLRTKRTVVEYQPLRNADGFTAEWSDGGIQQQKIRLCSSSEQASCQACGDGNEIGPRRLPSDRPPRAAAARRKDFQR
ncbi:hypothetical protein EVAR_25350_1 [Eumeta japonica]|uniref:Uncharacterized protein n=1 Tax=Eumeta variegata TaxID=151549 RepID=A0A4C1XZ25_EUMVA|nr:hypothetical protein EVAR_25350_1 [Eumeta japonica]